MGVAADARPVPPSQFPVTAIREIKILKVLNHKNVVQLKEIVTSKGAPSSKGRQGVVRVGARAAGELGGRGGVGWVGWGGGGSGWR